MTEKLERICSNCNSFFPDTFEWTEYGICLADEAFDPYLDDLLEHGNFECCGELIRAKRFVGDREVCSLYEEAELSEIPDESLEEIIGRLVEKKAGESKPKSPENSFEDHSFAWLLEHDERLRSLCRDYRKQTAEERRMAADFEYHAALAGRVFNQAIGKPQDAADLPGEVAALAIDPAFAPAILTVGSLEYIRGRVDEAMQLFLSLTELPADTEDLDVIIDKACAFLSEAGDSGNAGKLCAAASSV